MTVILLYFILVSILYFDMVVLPTFLVVSLLLKTCLRQRVLEITHFGAAIVVRLGFFLGVKIPRDGPRVSSLLRVVLMRLLRRLLPQIALPQPTP